MKDKKESIDYLEKDEKDKKEKEIGMIKREEERGGFEWVNYAKDLGNQTSFKPSETNDKNHQIKIHLSVKP